MILFSTISLSLSFGSPDFPVPGVLEKPDSKTEICAVIVPGAGLVDIDGTIGKNKFGKILSKALNKEGIATFRFGKRSHSYPSFTPDNTHDDIGSDLLAAIKLVKKKHHFKHIVLVGHGLGATLLPSVIKKQDDARVAVMLAPSFRSPYSHLLDKAKQFFQFKSKKALKQSGELVMEGYDAMSYPLSYWRDWKYRAGEMLPNMKNPKYTYLALVGGDDTLISRDDFRIMERSLARRPNVTLAWVPRSNHLFMDAGHNHYVRGELDPEMIELITNFIHSNN
ncbi:MAG: alpha/beta hydrolase [Simkaniaceae bacterium]|nr:alpha/beta hydrolase [Simkaniaceae bacterium]